MNKSIYLFNKEITATNEVSKVATPVISDRLIVFRSAIDFSGTNILLPGVILG
jgi:hypothetical protein